ncbi:hypothetical protein SEA_ATUIN_135 [Arthrobacter phage Atuin]|nr:hypothetical protein SEA_ATUIN_234 [Arthrobacter phage Atuin]
MALSREDKIRLAYKANRNALVKQGVPDRLHERTLLYVSELFNVSPLRVQKIVAESNTKN